MDLTAVGERPEISALKRSRLDVAFEFAAVLLLVATWGVGLLYYDVFPKSLSVHFDLPVVPDEPLVIEPVMATFLYCVLTGCSEFMSPRLYNYSVKVTERNARVQYTLARQMLSIWKVCVMGLFASITWGIGRNTTSWPILVWIVLLTISITIYRLRARRAQ
jgi:uncharacterized membrane protein